ncbi:BrnA antitoxin family protein [Variovorax paradoxus]|uniref:BrnA antitoxin of type II toxin-antitoxin system n=1 Tax=Variovorax paradoxus TaxID=34073 RepID=A0A0H2M1R4_VARPD|nr:BrnA antitoxin family protein [Variovorax paradoxus]KLN56379.1 hypothetical protein VPARA_23210 [Variovorax paradoxus]
MPKTKDSEMEQFEKDLLQSIGEMKRGEHAVVHTPAQMEARKRGRPAGSVKESPKVATTIRIDADVLVALKESGPGWQTRVNDALRKFIATGHSTAIPDTKKSQLAAAYQAITVEIDHALERQAETLETLRKQLTETNEAVKAMESLAIKQRKSTSTT